MRNGLIVADAHAHVFPRPITWHGRTGKFTAENLIRAMDADGIDLSVVIARSMTQLALPELISLHDDLAEAVRLHPRRLRPVGWASPRLGIAGLLELERCLSENDFVGIELHPEVENFNIDDEDVLPIVDLAAEYAVPVWVYTQLGCRGAEPWRLARLARKRTYVQFVMSHMGGDGWMLQSGAATEIASWTPNILVEVSGTVTDPWATYCGPVETLGAERVMFASDVPLHEPALNLLKLDLLEMDINTRAQIIGGNLLRLLDVLPTQVGHNGSR